MSNDRFDESSILLKAYYERLYQFLEAKKALLTTQIDKLLQAEITTHDFGVFGDEGYAAYRDACLAFVGEWLVLCRSWIDGCHCEPFTTLTSGHPTKPPDSTTILNPGKIQLFWVFYIGSRFKTAKNSTILP